MIKYTKFFITILLAVTAFGAMAQSTRTSSSPYSRYGLGDLNSLTLPQNKAMGGIATAINRINGINTINSLNPASYSAINFTTFDIGVFADFTQLSQTGQSSAKNSNFRINHIAFAFPVSPRSALSFGLMPYSTVGYNYRQSFKGFGTGSPVDTNTVNNVYNGEGGLSKAYFGYGFGIGRNFSVGANISYIFGNLKNFRSVEMPNLSGVLNSRIEESNAVGGVNYDFGAQYRIDLSLTRHIVLGYAASAGTKLNSQSSYIASQYSLDGSGNENVAADSVVNTQGVKTKIQLPQVNHFGISYQKDEKYLIGMDYSFGNWSGLTIGGVNQGLSNSSTFNIGGQFTPNLNAIGNYFAIVDYRLGAIYDQTYFNVNNPTGTGQTQIKSYAVTFGLGLPLRANNQTFYKINLSAEVGQRGTLQNSLVRERYVNIHLGFTLNDRWFQRYRFD
jgi:hypothetical protein